MNSVTPAPPAVQFQNVNKSFPGPDQSAPVPVLRQISGTIPAGSITTLIGPSGSGKSTLLSLCNLLLTPDEGSIRIQGQDIHSWPITRLRRTVGMVFQDSLMLPGTVQDNLLTASRLHGTDSGDPARWLEQAELPSSLLSRPAQELSGGQRQRLALLRTLVGQPDILLLDEITSALDPSSVKVIERLLLQLNEVRGTTLIWVTHQMEQARQVSQYTWFLQDGRLVESGPAAAFFAQPQTTEAQRFLQGESS
ncbi:ABC transporter ATP-binding protein [Paenibacillus wulumuqiensis]|uniref:ABC transporter ATP-binding protein n=1 Tax=Paenibacillus wulumuqiensis TaxID=1567107 RepID=UPI0006198AAC|nr:phosphate ABC transporter ATP-binding protein [Paenibacillus wulumuqiensis]